MGDLSRVDKWVYVRLLLLRGSASGTGGLLGVKRLCPLLGIFTGNNRRHLAEVAGFSGKDFLSFK